EPALQALAQRYRVSYSREAPDAHGDYEVGHSVGVFVFDRAGRARLLVRPEDAAPDLAADLDRLAGEAGPGVH
ncbi:MAG TPA: SCO family protein, partial [Burkholderiales bacterium]|nr:SCO family protein [Burkholderiales bacterium]